MDSKIKKKVIATFYLTIQTFSEKKIRCKLAILRKGQNDYMYN